VTSPKREIRNPKEGRRTKSERAVAGPRISRPLGGTTSDFGFPIRLEFWISDFGFHGR
jgi:hypothetical protein